MASYRGLSRGYRRGRSSPLQTEEEESGGLAYKPDTEEQPSAFGSSSSLPELPPTPAESSENVKRSSDASLPLLLPMKCNFCHGFHLKSGGGGVASNDNGRGVDAPGTNLCACLYRIKIPSGPCSRHSSASSTSLGKPPSLFQQRSASVSTSLGVNRGSHFASFASKIKLEHILGLCLLLFTGSSLYASFNNGGTAKFDSFACGSYTPAEVFKAMKKSLRLLEKSLQLLSTNDNRSFVPGGEEP